MKKKIKEKDEEKKEWEKDGAFLYELCVAYRVGRRQFLSWIEPFKDKIGAERGRKFTPQQVRTIFECLDPPP